MKVKTNYVPESSKDYLTEGKEYKLNSVEYTKCGEAIGGDFYGDNGEYVYVFLARCSHIDNEAWTVIED